MNHKQNNGDVVITPEMVLGSAYIWLIKNTCTKKIYVAKSVNMVRSYLGSGTLIKKEVLRYGRLRFTNKLLEVCPIQKANIRERYWIKKLKAIKPQIGYNLTGGGPGVMGYKRTLETVKKLKKLYADRRAAWYAKL